MKAEVMIVDDTPNNLKVLSSILKTNGFKVRALPNAKLALKSAVERRPEIFLLDIMMPDIDGFELCSMIKANNELKDIPVIFISALTEKMDKVRSFQLGGADYITKPFHEEEVIARVNVHIQLRRNQLKLETLNENLYRENHERKSAEKRVKEVLQQVQKSYKDTLSILNGLHIGCMIINNKDNISFLNYKCRQIAGLEDQEDYNAKWYEILPVPQKKMKQIQSMFKLPVDKRIKLTTDIYNKKNKPYTLEIDIKDDPRDPTQKILFVYDVSEINDLRKAAENKNQFYGMIGKSKPMQILFDKIQKVAIVDWPVLIEGNTGTGKELVAKALHQSSARKEKTFLGVNCAEFSESLLSSQLFGHKKGAFTGANQDHIGFFETCNEGTLFLDEIGEIPINLQTKLLRVLEEGEIMRVGESQIRKINVRVITATNRDLSHEVEIGNFRADLLYRIRINRIHVPALKDRHEDIPLLLNWFLRQTRAISGREIDRFDSDTMELLMSYKWPGNVRELKGVVEYAVINSSTSTIKPMDLPPEIFDQIRENSCQQKVNKETDFAQSIYDNEVQDIKNALIKARGNKTKCAELLNISRVTLWRRMKELGLKDK